MKIFFDGFKRGIGFGLGFFIMVSTGVFAYQYSSYLEIEDVSKDTNLTSNTFNQLLANVRDLNSRIGTNNTHFARYYIDEGATQTANNGEWTKINYTHKEYDYDNAVTTGKDWNYKVPEDGLYLVNACASAQSTTVWNAGSSYGISVNVNGINGKSLFYQWTGGAYTGRGDACGSKILKVKKDDLISFYYAGWVSTSTLSIGGQYAPFFNYAEITRIGD